MPFSRSSAAAVLLGLALGLAFCLPMTAIGALCGLTFAAGLPAWYRIYGQPRLRQMWFMGLSAHGAVFHWMPEVISFFGGIPVIAAALLFVLFAAISSVQFLFFELLRRQLAWSGLQRMQLDLPCAWAAAEVLFPQLVPWTLGHSIVYLHYLTQPADLFGGSFVSLLLLWSGCLFAERKSASSAPPASALSRLAPAAAVLCGMALYSGIKIAMLARLAAAAPALTLGLVQPNLDLQRDFSAEAHPGRMAKLRAISKNILAQGRPDLLIWPESAVGFDYRTRQTRLPPAGGRHPFPGLDLPLIFGGQTRIESSAAAAYHNSIFSLAADGALSSRYDKQRLVPFAEFNPLALPTAAAGNAAPLQPSIMPGRKQRALRIVHPRGELFAAAVLCYEDMFPRLVSAVMRNRNPGLLISLSNNAWFLGSIAAVQHHHSASFRAIELGRYFVRASNNGFTGIIDPFGRTIESLPRFADGFLYAEEITLFRHRTFYFLGGGTLMYAMSYLLLGCVLVRAYRDCSRRR